MMGLRGSASGIEVDAFSRRSRRMLTWKQGELRKIKRQFWKRVRKTIGTEKGDPRTEPVLAQTLQALGQTAGGFCYGEGCWREKVMAIYRNAEMESFYAGEGSETSACQIRITGSTIVLSYDHSKHGLVTYQGTEVEPGHYKIACPALRGRGTLHRFDEDEQMEGSWYEEGYTGMWRFDLGEEG